jgi:hypothetical protein
MRTRMEIKGAIKRLQESIDATEKELADRVAHGSGPEITHTLVNAKIHSQAKVAMLKWVLQGSGR